MDQQLSVLHSIFTRTRDGIKIFMDMLAPKFQNAEDEHERLYFHHIYEEEEHRLERLNELIPKFSRFLESGQVIGSANRDFIGLLQDINLEKFGLHNFLEHLDLALFEFRDGPEHEKIMVLRDETRSDYLQVKEMLNLLNERIGTTNSVVEKESDKHRVATAAHGDGHEDIEQVQTPIRTKKGLTVGSLKF